MFTPKLLDQNRRFDIPLYHSMFTSWQPNCFQNIETPGKEVQLKANLLVAISLEIQPIYNIYCCFQHRKNVVFGNLLT